MFTFHPAASRHLSSVRREFASSISAPLVTNRNPSRESLRPHDDDASHPICLEKLAQFLFHDKAPAARRVTQEHAFAVAHDDSSMKHIKILARGYEKHQITALQ